jgi:hypothetical protein
MSYLDRIQKNREAYEASRGEIPSSINQFQGIDPDQSNNIFNDKMNEERDELFQKITAPLTAIGSARILKRGVGAIKSVQDLKTLYNKGGEFSDKIKSMLGNENVQKFINDPESALANMGETLKNKVISSVNEGLDNAKDTLSGLGEDAGDGVETLGSKIGSIANDAKNALSSIPSLEEGTALAENSAARISQAVAEGFTRGASGGVTNVAHEATGGIFKQAPQEDPDLQAAFDKADEEEKPINDTTNAQEDAGEDEDIFHDSKEGFTINENAQDALDRAAANRGGPPKTGESIEGDPNVAAQKALNRSRGLENQPEDIDTDGPQILNEGAPGAQLDEQRAIGEIKPAPSLRNQVAGQEEEGKNISDALKTEKIADGAPEAGDSLGGLAEAGGEEGGAEVAAGLGIADAIPVIGWGLDLGSIGAIVGESVDYYNNKHKEAQAEKKQAQREAQIQMDVATEQSELVNQGRQAAQARTQQVQQISQQAQPLPTSQAGFEPT